MDFWELRSQLYKPVPMFKLRMVINKFPTSNDTERFMKV